MEDGEERGGGNFDITHLPTDVTAVLVGGAEEVVMLLAAADLAVMAACIRASTVAAM